MFWSIFRPLHRVIFILQSVFHRFSGFIRRFFGFCLGSLLKLFSVFLIHSQFFGASGPWFMPKPHSYRDDSPLFGLVACYHDGWIDCLIDGFKVGWLGREAKRTTARFGLAGRSIDRSREAWEAEWNEQGKYPSWIRAPLSDGERSEPGCGVCLTWRA